MSASSGLAAGIAHAIGEGFTPLPKPREREEPRTLEHRCDVCGNHYDSPLEIRLQGVSGTYDCFECAIQALAPTCGHCGCRVIGHGVEDGGVIFCCAHCARATDGHAAK